MNIERLQACADVLGEMVVQFGSVPEEKEKAVEAALFCALAQNYVAQYATQLADGLEPYDAMVETVKEERKTDAAKSIVLRVMDTKPIE
jgi:alpha-D-ribose 1-methylphosphonate 5-triphosphate synthase subunit PhnG